MTDSNERRTAMQPDTITIVTDVLNNGTTENHVFTRVREEGLKSTYHGPAHSTSANNKLALAVNDPKPSGIYPGTQKSSFKRTLDVTVVGTDGANVKMPAIVEVSTSFPVGMTAASQLVLRQECLNLLDQDAIMVPLQNAGVY